IPSPTSFARAMGVSKGRGADRARSTGRLAGSIGELEKPPLMVWAADSGLGDPGRPACFTSGGKQFAAQAAEKTRKNTACRFRLQYL
ncbi:MAG: hypothetical protein OEM98_17685, partial [Gammaproteobacteria bacterium]|nr:hypothetical protein [Gammaproteobacteria bacterium]